MVRRLVQLLGGIDSVAEAACYLLAACSDVSEVKAAFLQAGGVPRLLLLLGADSRPLVQASALEALLHLSQG